MPVYRLVPIAEPDDPNWDRALNQGEVVVRASSSGEARAMAALEEARAATGAIPNSTTQVRASAFRDEKLYTVRDDHSGEFPAAGPVQVLRAHFTFPENFVGHHLD
jgi:hypothetical protein